MMTMKNTILIICFSLIIAGGIAFASESGTVSPAPFPKVGQKSPPINSKFFVMEAEVKNGTASVTIPLDTPSKGIALVLGEPSIKAFAVGKQALEPLSFQDNEMKKINLPAKNTRFNLDPLSPGRQSINLSGIKNGKSVHMVISQPESPLQMQVQTAPLAARCGEKVTVTAAILDKQFPQQVEITAALPGKSPFNLNDSGLNGDQTPGDGVYSGTFTAPRVNGFQGVNIRFTAKGKRFDGIEFQRNAINSVMVTQPQTQILRQQVASSPDSIIVPVKAARGKYRIEIIFGYDGTAFAYARRNFTMWGTPAEVKLPIPEEALAANQALIRLLNKNTLGLEEEFEIQLTPTQPPPDFSSLGENTPTMPESKKLAAEKIKEEEQNSSHHNH